MLGKPALRMSDRGFEVLIEDDAILVVSKSPGLPTQAPPGIESLESRIRSYLASESGDPAAIYLGIPHRLDRPASGAIVFAKTRRAARQLSRQFERRQVRKTYWACVERIVEPVAGTWNDWLRKVYGHPQAEVVDHSHPEAQEAILRYRTIGFHAAGSWLEIELETGRTHQIRVQAASRGFPVLGDRLYGGSVHFGPMVDDVRLSAIALHARQLSFFHPTTKEQLTARAPVNESWRVLGVGLAD
jgi:23S rRNA pseudouridine1911/1915/1917 synthase